MKLAIMVIDIIISHKISTLYTTVGRSFYTPNHTLSIAGGAEIWQGYYQSARPTRGKMLINIDLSATAFYESGPLIHMVTKILDRGSPENLIRGFSDKDRQSVEKVLKGLKIRDNHRTGTRQTFKIEGLTATPASHITFEKDGGIINVKTYFQNVYNRRLVYPSLPCVVVRKNIYLPFEVCDVISVNYYVIHLAISYDYKYKDLFLKRKLFCTTGTKTYA
jgi:hypothetical protein